MFAISTCFSAYTRPLSLRTALYTTPNEPLAMVTSFSKSASAMRLTPPDPGAAGGDALNASYASAKGLLEHLAAQLNLKVSYHRVEGEARARLPMWLHPARCGEARLQHAGVEYSLGFVGNLHPDVSEALSLGEYCAAFEWDLAPLITQGLSYGGYSPIPRFPSVSFDLSVIVPEAVTHDDLHGRIMQAKWVKGATCVAVYRGEPVPEGEKSVNFQIIFQADGTLEMDAVNKVVEKLMRRLKSELGGWVRV